MEKSLMCLLLYLQLIGTAEFLFPSSAEASAIYLFPNKPKDAVIPISSLSVRKMTFANATKSDIQTIEYAKAIEGLGLNHDQFVDLCILLGCDYCDTIRGVGPKTALKLIREHGSIEGILKKLDRTKYGIPDGYIPDEIRAAKKKKEKADKEEQDYNTDDETEERKEEPKPDEDEEEENVVPVFVQARHLFNEHEVLSPADVGTLKWEPCKADELKKFLVDEMGFSAERVTANIERLQKAHKAMAKPQARMDSFFTSKAAPNASALAAKRKAAKEVAKTKKVKKAGGFFGKKRRWRHHCAVKISKILWYIEKLLLYLRSPNWYHAPYPVAHRRISEHEGNAEGTPGNELLQKQSWEYGWTNCNML